MPIATTSRRHEGREGGTTGNKALTQNLYICHSKKQFKHTFLSGAIWLKLDQKPSSMYKDVCVSVTETGSLVNAGTSRKENHFTLPKISTCLQKTIK